MIEGLSFSVQAGECVVLGGPSGAGKSSVLKMLYGNYVTGSGCIHVRHGAELVDIVAADPRLVLAIRRRTLGYVSQFLRVIPRVSALDIVAEPALAAGLSARRRWIAPPRCWRGSTCPNGSGPCPPATFSAASSNG